MRSAVNAAVLSLVIEQPSHGYEIGRRFEERYDGLLAPRQQHVYRALRRLAQTGMVEQVPPEGLRASASDVWRATAKGARAYREWLRKPVPRSADAPLQIRIRLAATRADDLRTVHHLLDAYEQVVVGLGRRPRPRSGNLIDLALDEERRVSVDAATQWVAWVRDELRKRAGEPSR